MGALVERRRHEYRGATGAEGRGAAGSEGERGLGRRVFWLKIVHFGVYYDKNSQFIRFIAGLKNYM